MAVSYKKLWKLLIDHDMKKKDLAKVADISNYTITKMSKGENVTVETLGKICAALNCGVDDIMGDMIVNIIGCLGVCVYIGIGIKFNPHWFSNKVILTSSQVRTMAEAFAEQEIAKTNDAEPNEETTSSNSFPSEDLLSSLDEISFTINADDDETLIN